MSPATLPWSARALHALLLALARLLERRGNAPLAAACLRRAASLDTRDPRPHFLQGRQLLLESRFAEAAAAFREALRLRDDYAEAHNNLGVALYELGDVEAAAGSYRAALRHKPDYAAAHNNLGNVLLRRGEGTAAEASFREALRIEPRYAEALNNLAMALRQQGRQEEAEGRLEEALRIRPGFAGALNNLAGLYHAQGRIADAVRTYEQALQADPRLAEAHANLALVRGDTVALGRAIGFFEREVRLHPESPEARNRLGAALHALGKWDEALAHLDEALRLRPGYADAYANLGNTRVCMGDIDAAIEAYRRSLELAPSVATHSSYAFYLNYSPDYTPEQVLREYLAWGRTYAPQQAERPMPPRAARRGRLRVGYVSADFNQHSVSFFIEEVLRRHDRSAFEVHCYFNGARADEVTARLRAHADAWRDIRLENTEDVLARVRADEIDVLVDLNGHTSGSRLAVFAMRAAPVQITYVGHPNTSAVAAMDYRLTDAVCDPPGPLERLYTETLVRLPRCFLAYRPPDDAPDPAPCPFEARGHVTFGSFNVAAKINPRLVRTWASILARTPGSRLVLKSFAFSSAAAVERFRGLFAAEGIAAERLDLLAFVPAVSGHLGVYAQVDIALDTFPYNGTTTTCEALWMGVPVVTRSGDAHVSRVGQSLLHAVGHGEWVAQDEAQYIGTACGLAADPEGLRRARATLREAMRHSELTDAEGLTRELERAYRRFVEERAGSLPAVPAAPVEEHGNAAAVRRLHLGGVRAAPGWEILNAVPGEHVDHLGSAHDLSRFPDETFAAIYASHILEHLDFTGELQAALKEWRRVLVPGGILQVSVPDLDVLAGMLLDPALATSERFHVMRMMFGGHVDAYDYHRVGLNEAFLREFLAGAGFGSVQRVESFGVFDDTSELRFRGRRISLNLQAVRAVT